MNNILLYAIPRSGSTLTRQVLKIIFPDKNIKFTHSYLCKLQIIKKLRTLNFTSFPIVGTIRDFRDVFVSRWGIMLSGSGDMGRFYSNPIMSKDEIKTVSSMVLEDIKIANKYKKKYKKQMLWLRYEKFYNNFGYFIEQFQQYFNVNINQNLVNIVKNECNLEVNKKRASKMKNFSEWDKESEIHGDHIVNGKVNKWRNYILKEDIELVNNIFSDELINWDYLI